MLYSLRTALLTTMLAVTIVAIAMTTLFASLTTRIEFSRYLEVGRDVRNEQMQAAILEVMRSGIGTGQSLPQAITNEEGSALLESSNGIILNPGNFRIYALSPDSQRIDLTKTRAISATMNLRFEMTPDGDTALYDGDTRMGMVYVDPITELDMMPAEIEFVQSVNDGIMAGALLAIVAAVTMAMILSRRILKPIRALTHAAKRMESGDLSQQVSARARGEIGELMLAFNAMAAAIARNEDLRRNMVSDIAHELRTPLTNLRGYLEAVQDGFVAPDAHTINLLHDEAMLLNQLVQDLQELALAEAGQLHVNQQAVTIEDIIGQTVAIVQPTARQKSLTLAVRLADDLPVVVGDQRRVAQIIRNLINNAIRHTPTQGTVIIEAYQVEAFVAVTITDSGEGIPSEQLPYIFERFYRIDSSRNRATGGAGLGLAICKYLVEAQGGTIRADSRLEQGASFTFTLPIYSWEQSAA